MNSKNGGDQYLNAKVCVYLTRPTLSNVPSSTLKLIHTDRHTFPSFWIERSQINADIASELPFTIFGIVGVDSVNFT